MWAPRGRKKQLPGLSLWKKKSSCSCGGVGAGKTSPRGTPASEPQKSRVLFQGSKFAKGSPGRCGGGRGERRRPAPAARPPAPGCWGRRRRPRAAASGAPRGPPKTRPSSAGRERSKTGGGAGVGGGTRMAGSPTSPASPVPLSLPSAHGGPRSAPCARGGGRGRAAAAGRTCEGDGRTNGHSRWTDGHSRRPCRRPAPSSPRMSPGTPGAHR